MNQQGDPEARACLNQVQNFRRTRKESPSTLSTSEAPPSLTYEPGASTTTETFASQETIPVTEVAAPYDNTDFILAEHAGAADLDDEEFMRRLDDVFTNKTNGLPYQLDPNY